MNKCLCGYPLKQCKENEKKNKTAVVQSRMAQSRMASKMDEYFSMSALKLGAGIGFGGIMSIMIFWDKARHWVIPPQA